MVLDSIQVPNTPKTDVINPVKAAALKAKRQPNRSTIAPEQLTEFLSAKGNAKVRTPRPVAQSEQRIFLFTNSAGLINDRVEASLVRIRSMVAEELKAQGFAVVEVPTKVGVGTVIPWINQRSRPGDFALSLQVDAFMNPDVRGAAAFYTMGDSDRRQQAEHLLEQLVNYVPNLTSRGAKPDAATALGSLAFTRQLKVPAIALMIGFETNPNDRRILLNYSQAVAQGIANGLASWQVPSRDRANLCSTSPIWNPTNRTIFSQSLRSLNHNKIGSIMSRGSLSRSALEIFLRSVNPKALQQFPEIIDLYLEEAAIEGVNADVAFAQALLETNFFYFGGDLKSSQNNFGGLAATGAPDETATFSNARIGVRAHIQQLKAYASQKPLVRTVETPRFRFVARGTAPRVEQLSDRTSADPIYSKKLTAILNQMYVRSASASIPQRSRP